MVNFEAKKTPLYLQVKDHIKTYIGNGYWPIGHKLPSERELAREMGVSRKTVSLAYKELVNEGILSSHQGKGTFVIELPGGNEINYKSIIETIDSCIDFCIKMGIDTDTFLKLCKQRLDKYKEKHQKLNILLIECNKEQIDYFCKELHLGPDVTITPMLLQELSKDRSNIQQKLSNYDFLITTLFHLEEVTQIICDNNKS